MGYSTDFWGEFTITPELTPEHQAYLHAFANTRRMRRNPDLTQLLSDPLRVAVGLDVGNEGEYYVGAYEENPAPGFIGNFKGQGKSADIIDYNSPPRTQPGLWCQWVPAADGAVLEWDQGEKFYSYLEWLEYLLNNFLIPWGYTLNGTVEWSGEDSDDQGRIVLANNKISILNRAYNWVPSNT